MITSFNKKIYKIDEVFLKFNKNVDYYNSLETRKDKKKYLKLFSFEHSELSKRSICKLFKVSHNTLNAAIIENEDNYVKKEETRGRKSVSEKYRELEYMIKTVIENFIHVDSHFKNPSLFVAITLEVIIETIILIFKIDRSQLPKKSAFYKFLNKLGFNLKRVRNDKVKEKPENIDEHFEHLHGEKAKFMKPKNAVVISIDNKAKVKIGPFSRKSKSRINVRGIDHDFSSEEITPFGIYDLKSNGTYIYSTSGSSTADFMVDSIKDFLQENYLGRKDTLIILLDNGPENSSSRTQFIYRLVELAKEFNVKVKLLYYPPYHSKYNPIERVWAKLEKFWNGMILDTISTAILTIGNLRWKGIIAVLKLNEKIYKLGIKKTKKEMRKYTN